MYQIKWIWYKELRVNHFISLCLVPKEIKKWRVVTRGEHRAGPDPDPTRTDKPDYRISQKSKPSLDPITSRLCRSGSVGIGIRSGCRYPLLFLRFWPVPSRPDYRMSRKSKPSPDPITSRLCRSGSGGIGNRSKFGFRAVMLTPSCNSLRIGSFVFC